MKLRFSIRDLLWLTLAVALAVGWWIDRYRFRGYVEGFTLAVSKSSAGDSVPFIKDWNTGKMWFMSNGKWSSYEEADK